jgi:hypothetical protein
MKFCKIDNIVEKNWIIFSTIYTLIMALIAYISNNSNNSICAFILGVCIIIFQLVFLNYLINDRHKASHEVINKIKETINRNENIIPPGKRVDDSNEIWDLINSREVHSMTIICYGTSGFDGIIPQLYSSRADLTVKTDILVCSPDSDYILFPDDKVKIQELIDKNSADNIIFTKSPVPSTIRACILYDNSGNPIWSSIQTYYYNYDVKHHSFDYRNSFTIVAKKDGSSILLNEMDKIIKTEFKRLKDFELKKEGLNDNQIEIVRYIEEKGKITIKEYKKINKKNNKAINELAELIRKNILKEDLTIKSYVLVKHK